MFLTFARVIIVIQVFTVLCLAQDVSTVRRDERIAKRKAALRALYSGFQLATELANVRPGLQFAPQDSTVRVTTTDFEYYNERRLRATPISEAVTAPPTRILEVWPGKWSLNGQSVCSYLLVTGWADPRKRYSGLDTVDWSRSISELIPQVPAIEGLGYSVKIEHAKESLSYKALALYDASKPDQVAVFVDYILGASNVFSLFEADMRTCFDRILDSLPPSGKKQAQAVVDRWTIREPCKTVDPIGLCCDEQGICKVSTRKTNKK